MSDRGARGRVWLICCILQRIYSPPDLRAHFDCAGLQNLVGCHGCSSSTLVVVPCAFSGLVITFRGRSEESPVFWWSIRSTFRELCRCGRFVNRDFWTCVAPVCRPWPPGPTFGAPQTLHADLFGRALPAEEPGRVRAKPVVNLRLISTAIESAASRRGKIAGHG